MAEAQTERPDVDDRHIQLLQGMAVFGAVSDGTLRTILALSSVARVARNKYFFRQDDPGDAVYVLEEGRVAVIKRWQERDFLLRELDPGDCFGEMALMDYHPRSAAVLALEDCCAVRVDTSALARVQEQDLEQFTLIQMNMGREVSRRLREANERIFRHVMEVEVRNGTIVAYPKPSLATPQDEPKSS